MGSGEEGREADCIGGGGDGGSGLIVIYSTVCSSLHPAAWRPVLNRALLNLTRKYR